MAWTVEEAIEETRELHPAFDPQTTPNSVLLRALNRYHAELYDRIINLDPHYFSEEWALSFPLSNFDAGESLPADWDTPLGGDVKFDESDRVYRLNFIPWGNRHSPGCRYPAAIIGSTLMFIGLEDDWDQVDEVTVHYVPQVTQLTSKDDTADLPDQAKGVVVQRIALTAASRAAALQGEPVDLGYTMEEWKESESEFLLKVARPAKAETAYIREVW